VWFLPVLIGLLPCSSLTRQTRLVSALRGSIREWILVKTGPENTFLTLWLDTTKATATWSVIEAACGVISACLPALRPLLAKISTQFSSLSRSSQTPKRSGSIFLNPDIVTYGGSAGTTSVTAKKPSRIRGTRTRNGRDDESDEYPLNERIHVKQTLDISESRTESSR
jgi:hypothetical protein